jgi:hypothetical protein
VKVYGLEVTAEQERAVMERMKSRFTNRELRKVWIEVGYPYETSATDQIIQREKKAGKIIRHGKEWHPKEK